jgi:hypothetical protein
MVRQRQLRHPDVADTERRQPGLMVQDRPLIELVKK